MTTPQQGYKRFLENLSSDTLGALPDYVTENVHFQDPFNDVHGVEAMTEVFRHMFANVAHVRFRVHQIADQGDICFMAWTFEGILRREPWSFDGTSVLRFTEDGRVSEHIDYWDAARHFYERLPVIGWMLARLRRRLAVR